MPTHNPPARRPRLERRPEATSFAVDDLLAAVADGRIRVPRFQRGMRWGPGDRVALLDSVARGYPVGTLLFWKRKAPRAEVRIGGLSFEAEERSDALWVVDGQQRITTLAEALLAPAVPGVSALHYDMEDDAFLWELPDSGVGPKKRLVPAAALLDTAKLMEWVIARSSRLDERARAAALEVGKRLREYRLPAYIVDTSDESVPRVIFERINRTGARMSDAEVFHALYASEAPQTSLRDVRDALRATGWGEVPEELVLRVFQAIEGLALDQPLPNDLGAERVRRGVERTSRALVEAVLFLKERGSIPHAAMSAYALPVVVLSRFFDAFPAPDPRSLTLLRRWLWRGLCGLGLAGAIVDLRRHLRAIRHGEEHASVQALLRLAPAGPAEDLYELAPVHFRTARTKVQCCALAALEPRDLRDGSRCDVGTLVASHEQSPLARLGDGNDLSLRLLHPALPTANLMALIAACDDGAVLASHATPPEARDALRRGDVASFQTSRARTLRAWFERFFARMAEWGADDSPPLSALATADDEGEDHTPGPAQAAE